MNKIKALAKQYDPNSQDVLFRVFYYDCRAYGGTAIKPDGTIVDFANTSSSKASMLFLRDLKNLNQMALRLGDLSFNGWKLDKNNPKCLIPDFKQKSVDMKIGLDIAWMATKKTVDKLVLVAGDADFVSPMKYARKEGLLIYLDAMQQKNIKSILREHSDFILT